MALLSASTAGVVLAGLTASFYFLLSRSSLERIDHELMALAVAQIQTYRPPSHWNRFEAYLAAVLGREGAQRYLIRVCDGDGMELYRSRAWHPGLTANLPKDQGSGVYIQDSPGTNVTDGPLLCKHPECIPAAAGSLAQPVYKTVSAYGRPWRFICLNGGLHKIQLGLDLTEHQADLRRFRRTILALTPWILLPMAVFGWAVGKSAMKSVAMLTATVRGVTAGGLDQRITAEDSHAELQGLIDVINRMLQRLERSFMQANRFGANAAHELKTPLTILQGELQRALNLKPAGSDDQTMIAGWLEEVQRLKIIVQKLLLLANADAGQIALNAKNTDLSQELTQMIEDVLEYNSDTKITSEIESEIIVYADPDLLRQSFYNLISNSIRHNRQDGFVNVSLERQKDNVVFRISNSIEEGARPDPARLFEQFYRADTTRKRSWTEGSGLGLNLAFEIIRAHKGELRLESLTSDLITFVVVLPLAETNERE